MSRQKRLNKSMDVLFPQQRTEWCRVCNEPVVDGRWNYCSTRCRDIANAVQRMFIWDIVREQVLERDDHTCQTCGLTQEMQRRAYWHVRERIDERADTHADREELWERYGNIDLHVMEVDHIHRLADGGHPLDEANLQTLCTYCHGEKTAEENTFTGDVDERTVTLKAYLE